MSDILAARSQMAMSLIFHIIFAAIGVALPLMMVIAEGLWLRTHDAAHLCVAKRWAKGTAILFAYSAVVSGTAGTRESRADWKVTQDIANRMGASWNYQHPSEIMAEMASLTPLYAGVSYERLEGYNTLLWPVAPDGSDQPVLYLNGFPFPDNKARLYPLPFHEPLEAPDSDFDLFLNNGRILEHFHEGNVTYRVPGIQEETPERYLEISEDLAKERGIESGHWVRVTSRHGSLLIKVLVTHRVFGKQVYLSRSIF